MKSILNQTLAFCFVSILFFSCKKESTDPEIEPQTSVDSLYLGQTPPGNTPVVFAPDIVCTEGRYVQSSYFTPDGKEFAFTITNSSWNSFNVMYTQYEDGYWTTPTYAYFTKSTLYASWGLCFAPDSSTYYLMGARTSGIGGSMFWGKRVDNTWSDPVLIPDPISNSGGLGEPSVSRKNTLYFARNNDIYYSEIEGNEYKKVDKLPVPVSISYSTDIDPFISPDEDYIIFSSNRKGVYGQFDLYLSFKNTNGGWTNPKNLGSKINTMEWECVPSVSPNGKYLFYTRRASMLTSVPSKIYWVSTSFIDSLKFTNYDPYLLNSIASQTSVISSNYSFTIPDSTFFDDDGNETLTLSALQSNDTELPEWLNFSPDTKTFTGTPTQATIINIKITATDTEGANVSTIYKLTVE